MEKKQVIVSSCGRMLLLNKTLDSLKKHHFIENGIIIEDDDSTRHTRFRDFNVVHTIKKCTYVNAFNAAIEWAYNNEIDYIFHVEDDVLFQRYTSIGNCIEIMKRNNTHGPLCQIIFKRQKHTMVSAKCDKIPCLLLPKWLRLNDFCSIATGVFDVAKMRHIIAHGSSDGNCHESKTLTLAMKDLKYYSAVVDSDVTPGYDVIHVGEEVNCAKGNNDEEKVREYFDKLES